MPKGVYPRHARADTNETGEVERESDKMFPVKLLRNYAPRGEHEIIGYHKPAVTHKGLNGQIVELEPAAFVRGEVRPPEKAGTGFPNKIWKETHIALPLDEAKDVIGKRIAERADPVSA